MASNSPLAPRRYEPDPYSPAIAEDLLSGLNEWRNIQDIIRLTFKAVTDVVKAQGTAIKDLERQLPQKVAKTEFSAAISGKASTQELTSAVAQLETRFEAFEDFERQIQEKASRLELQSALKSKASLEDLQHITESSLTRRDYEMTTQDLQRRTEAELKELTRRLGLLASKNEVEKVSQQLAEKVSLAELEDGLSKKANKESVATALHRKANRTDVEAALAQKAEVADLQELVLVSQRDKGWVEQLAARLEEKADRQEITQHILPELSHKLDRGDLEDVHRSFRDLKVSLEKRSSDQSLTLDSHLGALRGEIDHVRVTLSSLLNKKADSKDIDSLVALMAKKTDSDYVAQIISASRDEIAERFEGISTELKTTTARKEEKATQAMTRIESELGRLEDEVRKTREQLIGVMEDRRRDVEENTRRLTSMTQTVTTDVQSQLRKLTEEYSILLREVEDLGKDKVDHSDFQTFTDSVQAALEEKAATATLQEEMEKWETELSKVTRALQDSIESEVGRLETGTEKKLAVKADVGELQKVVGQMVPSGRLSEALSEHATLEDFEGLKQSFSTLRVEIIKKANQTDLDQHVAFTRSALEDAAKDIVLKANIKDVCTLLDMKASKTHTDIDDVNKALVDLKRGSDCKLAIDDFRTHLRQQSTLNESLAAANALGRWCWKSGELRAGNAVPWEHQTLNTQPDNFLWERDKSNILVVAPGLYQLSFGFFARKKPVVQLLVNGEAILTSASSTATVQATRKGATITGLTLVDFLNLPARARLAVCYTGESESEGFISLIRL